MQCHYTCRGLISGGDISYYVPPSLKSGGVMSPCPPPWVAPLLRLQASTIISDDWVNVQIINVQAIHYIVQGRINLSGQSVHRFDGASTIF